MADSLEENYVLASDDEGDRLSPAPASGPSTSVASGSGKATKKRPHSSNDGPSAVGDESADDGDADAGLAMKLAAGGSTAEQKARRKARQKARKARLAVVRAEEEASRPNVALAPPEMQADWLRKEMARCRAWKGLSQLELDEVAVPQGMLVDSTAWARGGQSNAKERELKDLPDFIRDHVKDLPQHKDVAGQMGMPAVLVLTNNALRASHIARELRALLPARDQAEAGDAGGKGKGNTNKHGRKKAKTDDKDEDEVKTNQTTDSDAKKKGDTKEASLHIAKLFSRHFSPAEQVAFLGSHRVLAAAGTPQRIAVLLERGALKLDELRAVVLDAGWRDEKTRNMMDDEGGREGWLAVWDALREGKGLKSGGASSDKDGFKVILF